jgi:hypothetical protein
VQQAFSARVVDPQVEIGLRLVEVAELRFGVGELELASAFVWVSPRRSSKIRSLS